MDLEITQKDLADRIGVHETTVYLWEVNSTEPMLQFVPLILEFLGYNPFPQPVSLADKLILKRKQFGISQEKLAELIGVDPTSISRWERGQTRPFRKSLGKISSFLGTANNTGRFFC